MLFHQISSEILERLGFKLRIFIPVVRQSLSIVLKSHKKFKNDRNNAKPSRGVILCDMVARKNIKLIILIMSQKNLHKMTYLIRGFLAFGSNDQCYGQNQGIVCDNVPILFIHMHHGMANNVAGGSFPFRRTKTLFLI